MASDDKRQHPEFAAVVILIAVLAAGFHALTGGDQPASGAPDQPATAAAPPAAAPMGVSPAGWVKPVDAPVWGGWRTTARPNHNGVDLGASRGAQIRAASAGTVARVRCDTKPAAYGCGRDGTPQVRGCGWYVDIRHDHNIYTRYCHLGRAPNVKVGQKVAAGQVIGVVGSTGNSSAPHLHFEVHLGSQAYGSAVDPVAFMTKHGAPLGRG